jgi:hypothetical protein
MLAKAVLRKVLRRGSGRPGLAHACENALFVASKPVVLSVGDLAYWFILKKIPWMCG